MNDFQTLHSQSLPALSPDLVVNCRQGGRLQLVKISDRLAQLTGRAPAELRGLELDQALAGTVPPLGELAEESLNRDTALTDIRVRFAAAKEITLVADVRPAGLAEDYSGTLVHFLFRQPTPGRAETVPTFGGLIGDSAAIREVFRKIALYAPTGAAVVITGETGTGKELVARALHQGSERARGPFVPVNCSAISEELLESELFGHEKGAFTGALRTHKGRFERADGGTLFLDEIGDMPLHTQTRLLRVLEEKRVERVGSEQEFPVDVRIVCATNVPLEQAVGQNRFRADLYHRISVLRIHLPPLRQRSEDIPHLVSHFLRQFSDKYGRRVERLTNEALALLQSYLWPGNIRELRNVLERVYIETQSEVIGARAFAEWVRERQGFAPGDWGPETRQTTQPVAPPYPLTGDRLLLAAPTKTTFDAELLRSRTTGTSTRPADLSADDIRQAYRAAGGNLSAAARRLGVHRATLYRHLEKLGIARDELD
ncbi:sigma-54 interaction domain-containing protein [Trichloromonas sp.]|uniref:sigma-54 interaction domain-containing protein n=1 Tax=Trichloromonas sp. TaxID=3069249 RepID=UPI003D81B0E3